MDSLTHIVIGAATGGAILEKKVGNKALFWGAIAGSLPDFDSILTPFFEPVQALFFHRGFSHSILFAIIAAPILGWIISKIHKDQHFRQWTMLSLISILTHSLLDILNTYGTATLSPFSQARLSFDAIGIIDVFLMVPIVVLMILLIKKPKYSRGRQLLSFTILGYAFLFITFAIINKFHIENRAKEQLANLNIEYSRLKTSPLPVTNFLWLVIAEDSAGYHFGYIGNFDKHNTEFNYVRRNAELLKELNNNEKITQLVRFTDGYYTVNRKKDNSLWLYDLRYGSMAFNDEQDWYVFSFQIIKDDSKITVSRAHPNREFSINNLAEYWERVF
ncbi:MAG: metal-dependent hydrolase [Bacteroidales bacterium]